MSEEILINVSPTESRVALVENGTLQELWLDRVSQDSYLGNIYKGRVSRVLPGMQAAFVDIGLERTAFLHASDIVRVEQERMTGQVPAAPGDAPPVETPISALVREGAEVIVQVVKDPLGSKGARLTTNLSIPSRFLVLLPGNTHIGVSVRIEDEAERERLRCMVDSRRDRSDDFGYILRTNAEGVDEFALAADMAFLRKLWESFCQRRAEARPGQCIYQALTLPLRALRDLMHADVERVRIDHAGTFKQVAAFVERFIPEWLPRIEHFVSERPIFDLYGTEDEIEQALHRKTPLKSGGYLVIDQTEAMTTIDVNTGGFVGHRTLEETIYKTNLEAAQSIARQLRLRNLGGIIIIDFIDMVEEGHREQVMRTLERALERDPVRTSVTSLSSLGLVEMTRKRTRESLGHLLCEPCPVCVGRGFVKTAETVCQEIFREIMRSGRLFEASKVLVMAQPAVVDLVADEHSTTVAELEELIGKSIRFQREEQYNQDQFDVVLL
jgi:ribonuclease G